jgi:hypothetical protein
MTTGAGLFISENEQDQSRQNQVIRQLIEGRSNAVGMVTLTHDGVSTSTTVVANTCGPNSAVLLCPTTAHAAAALATTYMSSVAPRQFVITHASTSNSDVTFFFACFG